jgi:hypothetical protein
MRSRNARSKRPPCSSKAFSISSRSSGSLSAATALLARDPRFARTRRRERRRVRGEVDLHPEPRRPFGELFGFERAQKGLQAEPRFERARSVLRRGRERVRERRRARARRGSWNACASCAIACPRRRSRASSARPHGLRDRSGASPRLRARSGPPTGAPTPGALRARPWRPRASPCSGRAAPRKRSIDATAVAHVARLICSRASVLVGRERPRAPSRPIPPKLRITLLRQEQLALLAELLVARAERDDRVESRRRAVALGAQDAAEALRLFLPRAERAGHLDRDVGASGRSTAKLPTFETIEHRHLAGAELRVEALALRLRRLAGDQRRVFK